MIDVGRICVKIAGRDAGKKCVVVDVIDDNYVLIDGETRRRKSNILHLEPLDQSVDIKKGASHEAVIKAVEKLGWQLHAPKTKPKTTRPRHARRSKLAQAPAPVAEKKPAVKKPAVTEAPAKKAAPAEKKA